MATLGRQSRPHRDEARKWLDRAKEAANETRSSCKVALPALIRSHEALSFAWAHIDSIGDTAVRDKRAKRVLQDEQRELNKRVTRGYQAFADRCIIKR